MPLYLIFALVVCISAASIATLNAYLVLISLSSLMLLFFLYKLWDIFESLVVKRTGVVQVLGDYRLEADRLSGIRMKKGGFHALSAAVLRDLPSKEISKESLERIISGSNAPFKFVLQVERLNTGKISDDLKTRRRLKEMELSKAGSKKGADRSKVVEREIELIESEITSINSGASPLRTEIYLMSFADSESKFVAEERALSQVKAIAGEFSAVMGASFEVVAGADLLRLMEADLLCEVKA